MHIGWTCLGNHSCERCERGVTDGWFESNVCEHANISNHTSKSLLSCTPGLTLSLFTRVRTSYVETKHAPPSMHPLVRLCLTKYKGSCYSMYNLETLLTFNANANNVITLTAYLYVFLFWIICVYSLCGVSATCFMCSTMWLERAS